MSKNINYFKLLGNKDLAVKRFAINKILTMKKLNKEDIAKLLLYLNDNEIKMEILKVLEKYVGDFKLQSVVKLLEIEKDVYIRSKIYKIIAKSKDNSFFPILLNGLNEKDTRIKANILENLYLYSDNSIDDILWEGTKDSNLRVKISSYISLYKIGEHVSDLILNDYLIYSKVEDKKVFLYLMGYIKDIQFIDILMKEVRNLDISIRLMAVKGLRNYANNKEVIDFMIKQFYEERSIDIINCMIDMFILSKKYVVERWEKELSGNIDNISLANIAKALGRLKTDRSINILLKLLSVEDARVKANAIEALGEYKDNSYMINIILPYLKDRNPRVKAVASALLWKLGMFPALQTLKDMLNDTNELVQRSAAFILSTLKIF